MVALTVSDHGPFCPVELTQRSIVEIPVSQHHVVERNVPTPDGQSAEAPISTKTIQALVELYDAWGKPEQAAEWRAKLRGPAAATSRP